MEQPFAAEWARIGKKPGTREDYGVLEASDQQIRVGEFVGKYVAGVPSSSTRENAPAAPPWVTFGSYPTNVHRSLLSVLVQDRWDGQDQAGRPIWPQRFFLCWYDDAADVHASYRALWDAVSPVTLPRPDRQLVPIEIRPRSADSVVAAINEIGFEQAAAMAAALLAGPVAVTGTADLYLSNPDARLDRLAVLDAVAALLPYGFRADLSASSAVDNTVAHRMRLVLADYAKDSQQAAPLRGAPVSPRSDIARDYLQMLLDKKNNSESPETILAYLWEATDACSFAHPERAWEILNQLNRRRHKIRAVVTAPESPKSSLVFFEDASAEVARMWQDPEMTAPMRRKLVRPLLDSNDEAAAEALRRNWDVVTDTVITIVNRSLNEGDTGRAGRSLGVAVSLPRPEPADRLLLKLIVPPQEDLAEDWQLGIKTRAALLRQIRIPRPGDLGMTCITLRGGQADSWQGYLVKELLSREITEDPTADRAAGWATWLSLSEVEGNPAEWVLALGCVFGRAGGPKDYASVRPLIQRDAVWAATTLRLALHARRIQVVLEIPGLAEDLVGLADRTGTQAGQEDTRLALAIAVGVSLWDDELTPATIAAVDVARLLLGFQPQDFPHKKSQQECDLYLESLNHVLGLPPVQKRGTSFVVRFLNEVMPADAPERLSSGAACLLQAWSKNPQLVTVLASYVAKPEVTRLLWRDQRFNYEFWSRLVEHEPGLRHTLAVPLLMEMIEDAIKNKSAALRRFTDEQHGVTGSNLARAFYRAWRGGLQPPQIIEIIDSVSVGNTKLIHQINCLELDNVLREFESMLAYPAIDAEGQPAQTIERQMRAEDTLFVLWELICAGDLGPEYGRDFRHYLDERLKAEEAARKRARRRLRRTLRQRFRAFISRRHRRRAAAVAKVKGQAPGAWPAPPVPAVAGCRSDLTVPERATPLPRAAFLPRAELVPVRTPPDAELTRPLVKRRWWQRLIQRLFGGHGKRGPGKRATEGQGPRDTKNPENPQRPQGAP